MKNLYNDWYREKITLINKVPEIEKRINLLEDLLVEWDDNYSGSEDAKRIHRWITKKIKDEKKKINQQLQPSIKGFACSLPPDTVKKIYNIMIKNKQIAGREVDFLNIFANEPTLVEKPITWKITRHFKEKEILNNRAFHAFLRIMLRIGNDKLSRNILRIANRAFIHKGKPIYPDNKLNYPNDIKNKIWFTSTQKKHFNEITQLLYRLNVKLT